MFQTKLRLAGLLDSSTQSIHASAEQHNAALHYLKTHAGTMHTDELKIFFAKASLLLLEAAANLHQLNGMDEATYLLAEETGRRAQAWKEVNDFFHRAKIIRNTVDIPLSPVLLTDVYEDMLMLFHLLNREEPGGLAAEKVRASLSGILASRQTADQSPHTENAVPDFTLPGAAARTSASFIDFALPPSSFMDLEMADQMLFGDQGRG